MVIDEYIVPFRAPDDDDMAVQERAAREHRIAQTAAIERFERDSLIELELQNHPKAATLLALAWEFSGEERDAVCTLANSTALLRFSAVLIGMSGLLRPDINTRIDQHGRVGHPSHTLVVPDVDEFGGGYLDAVSLQLTRRGAQRLHTTLTHQIHDHGRTEFGVTLRGVLDQEQP